MLIGGNRMNKLHTGRKLFSVPAALAVTASLLISVCSLSSCGRETAKSAASRQSSAVPSATSKAPASSDPGSQAVSKISGKVDFSEADKSFFSGDVFLGDSITEGLEIYPIMDKATVLGEIGMSTYTAVSHQQTIKGKKVMVADAVKALNPKRIYIMLGSNDIEWMSSAQYIKYYGQLIDTLKKGSPNAEIVIQSILPVATAYTKKHPACTIDHITEFNTALQQMCKDRGLRYFDVASVMKDPDGKLPDKASDDGLHLRPTYYNYWFQYLLSRK